ncbi:tyrosinase family protein [Peribacillus sp. NPDC006672]|uniref:tyrosinase family protein n=1 Tax=Peribacillus sp. NPDC006672 TaxID=3390606 RepID=UPI003D04A32D
MTAEYNIRKNALHLSEQEKRKYIHAVLVLKEKGIYNRYVAWHAAAGRFQTPPVKRPEAGNDPLASTRSHNDHGERTGADNDNIHGSHGDQRNAAHSGPAFLPWHRYFLWLFERDLQSIDPSVTIPYWDWAADSELEDPASSPIWDSDFMGGNGNKRKNNLVDSGPFAAGGWEVLDEEGKPSGGLKRNFRSSEQVANLPTKQDVQNVLKVTPFDAPPWNSESNPSFRNQLEGFVDGPNLHNLVHGWVGGHMGSVPVSPNDPVFFLHHANVDRIWAMWKIRHREEKYLPRRGGPFSHNLNDPMFPWDITPKEMINHRKLGYIYDMERKMVKGDHH